MEWDLGSFHLAESYTDLSRTQAKQHLSQRYQTVQHLLYPCQLHRPSTVRQSLSRKTHDEWRIEVTWKRVADSSRGQLFCWRFERKHRSGAGISWLRSCTAWPSLPLKSTVKYPKSGPFVAKQRVPKWAISAFAESNQEDEKLELVDRSLKDYWKHLALTNCEQSWYFRTR